MNMTNPNYVLLNDRANYCLYLVRDTSDDRDRPTPSERTLINEHRKMAQMWLIEHAVNAACAMYASDIATVLTTNGTAPVPDYDSSQWDLLGSIAYAEFGGMMPNSKQRAKLKAAYDAAASKATALGIVKVSVGDDDPDRMPVSWYTELSDTLNVVI
jgi:hypothetical protein